jgi:hypothetical protein
MMEHMGAPKSLEVVFATARTITLHLMILKTGAVYVNMLMMDDAMTVAKVVLLTVH